MHTSTLPTTIRITGVLISYFVICPRKAWLFAKGLALEAGNELVELGRLITETTYPRQHHEIAIDRTIVMDWVDWKRKIIHEVKKSARMEEAHLWQVRYYIYYLEQKGATGFKGIINYPKQRRIQHVRLSPNDKKQLTTMINQLQELLNQNHPPQPTRIPACKACAYFEFCWI